MSKKIESDFGVIEYRLPDVPEALELLGELGVDKAAIAEIQTAKEENREPKINILKRSAQAMRHLGKFCTKIDLEDNECKVVTDYDTALKKLEFCMILMELAGIILVCLDIDAKKKPRSKTSVSSSPKKASTLTISKD